MQLTPGPDSRTARTADTRAFSLSVETIGEEPIASAGLSELIQQQTPGVGEIVWTASLLYRGENYRLMLNMSLPAARSP